MRKKEALSIKLREKGLKVTPQRVAILRALGNSVKHLCRENRYARGEKKHLCAEGIYRDVKKIHPSVSLNTVYTTLKTLRDIGEVVELNFGEDRNRYDIEAKPHGHVICVKCNKIEEVFKDEKPEPRLPESMASDYELLDQRVLYYVICPACRSKGGGTVRSDI